MEYLHSQGFTILKSFVVTEFLEAYVVG